MDDVTGSQITWSTPLLRKKVLYTALALALSCYAFFQCVLWPVQVLGHSMMPNYRPGTRHFVNKLAYWHAKPKRGDVIAFNNNDDVLIKRVIGLPGESVEFHEGRVFINGKELVEPYVGSLVPDVDSPGTLGAGQYYVMGDNRAISVQGPISMDRVIGKVIN